MIKAINLKIRKYLQLKMLRTTIALTSGRIFNMSISIILLLVQSRLVGPEITGIVGYFSIPIGYLWILTLGIPSALARELPYYLARGEREKALKLAQTTQSFSLVMGLLCGIVFLVPAAKSIIAGNYLYATGWTFQVILAFFTIYNPYITTLYRTTDEFIKIAKSNTISAITNIIVFPLIFINPFIGLCTKAVAGALTTNLYLYLKRPFKLKFGFDFKCFKMLFKFGMPIIVIGYFESSLWTSAQSTIIVTMGSIAWLGLYNFINQILIALLIIPNAVADILRPKLAAVYGETDGNMQKTLKVLVKPLFLTLIFSLFAMIFSWLFVGDIIRRLLPKYVDAIPALNYALLIVPVTALTVIKYVFVVCKNTLHNAISTLSGFLVGLGLLYWGLSNGMNFKYIFLPYVIGRLINFIVSILLLMVTNSNKTRKLRLHEEDIKIAAK